MNIQELDMEILYILGKTILFYVLLIFILRIMGKREVGELSIFDVVVFFLISELFSLAIDNETKLSHLLLPILLIVILQLITSIVALKSQKFRKLIDGEPVFIIKDGKINQKELKKQRYSIDDLLLQLRDHNVDSLRNVKYAILETNGKLSIVCYDNSNTLFPFPIIQDGIINYRNLEMINKDQDWLLKTLNANKIESYEKVFLFILDNRGPYIILKELENKKQI